MSKKHRHEEHEEHVDESWLVPYADILTLLLALFIVLYSMSSVDARKFEEMSNAFNVALTGGAGVLDMPSIIEKGSDSAEIIQDSKDNEDQEANTDSQSTTDNLTEEEIEKIKEQSEVDLSNLKEQLDSYIASNGLSDNLETSLNMSQLVITIRDNALFDSAEAKVNDEGRVLAKSIATMLEGYPDYNIVISGHTDNAPIRNSEFSSNWDLSAMRAVRFMDIMLANSSLNPARFSAVGYGEYHPVASNDTKEGKALNRRVELSIVNTYLDENKQQSLSVNP